MKKVVFIAPHLSTGGMPQYLVKRCMQGLWNSIILLQENGCPSEKTCQPICCRSWKNGAGMLVIQR